jgi:hypothetical protein
MKASKSMQISTAHRKVQWEGNQLQAQLMKDLESESLKEIKIATQVKQEVGNSKSLSISSDSSRPDPSRPNSNLCKFAFTPAKPLILKVQNIR